MNLINHLRNRSFWLIDSLKGGVIRKHLNEISFVINSPYSSDSLSIREQHLKNLLKHATESTPFYFDYKGTDHIDDFPVIRKTVIQENFKDFQSIPYIQKQNYKVSTSGSTGIPFFLFQNKNKRHRNIADVLYFSRQSNFKIGNRLYELEVWRKHNKKSVYKSLLQNIIQFDISKLTDSRILSLINLLKSSKQEKNILGFASSYEQICQYLDRNKTDLGDLNINAVIANSEYLNQYTKTSLSKHFNTAVLSRYSSEEVGIIAQQTLDSQEHFVINHASYYVELLDFDEDKPVKSGEYGRIVVTDLFNYCMPIIRYDTGDIAKLIKLENGQTKFEKIEGRKMDLIFDTKGNMISSFVVYTKFYNYYTLLKQYQFIQQSEKEYEVKLNVLDTFPFEKELIESIKKDFGSDAKVTITYVDEIPLLSSGKRKKVVNNYHKA
ncbi:CoF synthetase [Flavivirga spongiicola]|uniref:CoF synthetase n=1 Tax=Flavivirga spongiicola TaxID=421621 RepID=A0ABU7XXB5_9FLAO|nr:CoF synthetase [Flavivirga sp. MEBiC05379]MDO5980424.1 CoF synthetase [Flavivirga sp. MEBiC05379]